MGLRFLYGRDGRFPAGAYDKCWGWPMLRFNVVEVLILSAVMAAWVVAAYVLTWPRSRERRITVHRRIAAPRGRIWNLHRIDLDDPDNAALHDAVVAVRLVSKDPTIWENTLDGSRGHGTRLKNYRVQILAEREPEFYADRICELDGQPFPHGAEQVERLELVAQPDGTLATLTWSGNPQNYWHIIIIWYVIRRYLRRMQQICETGAVAPSAGGLRNFWIRFGL